MNKTHIQFTVGAVVLVAAGIGYVIWSPDDLLVTRTGLTETPTTATDETTTTTEQIEEPEEPPQEPEPPGGRTPDRWDGPTGGPTIAEPTLPCSPTAKTMSSSLPATSTELTTRGSG